MERKASIRGMLLRGLIARLDSRQFVGKRSESEPPWKIPARLQVEKIDMGNFYMEYLSPKIGGRKDHVILQLHGGAYVGTMNNTHRALASLYHEVSDGMDVLTIDYRVAPEDPFPAALEDALAAFDWLLEKGFSPNQVILAGDSAGGGLSLALSLYLKDHQKDLPGGFVLMSPWADLTASGPSYVDNFKTDPLFGQTRLKLIFDSHYIGEEDPKNPYLSPVFGDFEGFPPILIQVGSVEMLLSDSLTVAKKAKQAGGKVRLSVYEGMFHVFQKAGKLLPESRRAWAEIRYFFSKLYPRPRQ